MDIRRILVDGKKPTSTNIYNINEKLLSKLSDKGYYFLASMPTGTSIHLSDFRLSDGYVKKYGRNISPFTGRRGRVLGWMNWVEVNNTVNEVLDSLNVSANASTLKGKFVVRKGKKAYTEDDWEDLAYENVGSMVNPIYRRDTWLPEKEREFNKLDKVM